jgi:hypothetical protein
MTFTCTEIPEQAGLDKITVFWQDWEPGKGAVTITVWGSAWNCYFGGMGGDTIREFFKDAGTGYLVGKLGITRWLKQSKGHEDYLARIIKAVQHALARDAESSKNRPERATSD